MGLNPILLSTTEVTDHPEDVNNKETDAPTDENNDPCHPYSQRGHNQEHAQGDLHKTQDNDKAPVDSVKPLPTDTVR